MLSNTPAAGSHKITPQNRSERELKYRNWQVFVGNANPFPMIMPEAINEHDALIAAQERWSGAAVKPSGPAEELPDNDLINEQCTAWLRTLKRQDILQKLNQVKPALREHYRAALNELKKTARLNG